MRRPGAIAITALTICAIGLGGCASSSSSTPAASAATSAAASGPASAANALTIYYEDAAQFEIVAPSGRVIFIDVWNPSALAKTPTANDVLLTTHSHSDHYSPDFETAFPGKKITFEVATLKVGDISIESIAAVHDEGQELEQKGGSDYIFVIDVAGMRLAHFGDFGQDAVSAEQMVKLGSVDIAFSQLANPFSSMDETNRKGFNQMNQVKPKLLITTHVTNAVVELAPTIWKTAWATGPITISKAKLPAELTCLFMGPQAAGYGKIYNIPQFAS